MLSLISILEIKENTDQIWSNWYKIRDIDS